MGVTAKSLLRSPVLNSASFGGAEIIGVSTMIKFLKTFRRDENGAAAAEYALILAIIGTAIAASAILLGDAIGGVMDRAALLMADILP